MRLQSINKTLVSSAAITLMGSLSTFAHAKTTANNPPLSIRSMIFCLPRDIRELMPALRSQWFGIHIGSAVVAYAAFTLAACAGVKYLLELKKGMEESSVRMRQMDFFAYRLVILGIMGLTICIFTGAIWGEQAWSSFWQWDPKELWSLITWIVYAIYLHQRLRMKWHGKRMAIFAIAALGFVLFTFAGVNTLLPGLHSFYA